MTLDKDEDIVGMEVTNNFEGGSYIYRAVIIAITNKGRIIRREVKTDGEDWTDITPKRRRC